MILFGIRHKPSGRFMPHLRYGRGFTALDLGQFNHGMPRLLKTRIGAQRALSAWLKGAWENHTSGGTGMFGDDYDQWAEPPKTAPPDRKPDEMEVVEFRLTEKKAMGAAT
jgi:hypothetical protein